ncbi:hypothetical protein IJ531_05235 [bacterium]|nr:hypothetical protein [bacterium]
MINSAISAFLNNNNSDIDIQECFDEIFSGVCEPLNAGAFLSLLKQKGENLSDVLAGIKSASQALKKINIAQGEDIIENIVINPPGNMFDISLGVDIIVSASGVGVVKTALPDYLIQNTSFKTLEKLGINIEKLTPDNFEETKFIYSYIDKNSPYLKYTKELQRVLTNDSILKTINKFLNPYGAKNCTLALSSYNKVE